jgi:hypothetical protein
MNVASPLTCIEGDTNISGTTSSILTISCIVITRVTISSIAYASSIPQINNEVIDCPKCKLSEIVKDGRRHNKCGSIQKRINLPTY